MKILLTGSKGQLGKCLTDRIPSKWELAAYDSSQLDISSREEAFRIINEIKPDVIINAAAYTAVDQAEDYREKTISVNAFGPFYLAEIAKKVGSRLIHISTDYVFDGSASKPYDEESAVKPLGIYGTSKLAGELLAKSVYPQIVIIRTSWVFSEYGKNFVKTILRLCKDRELLKVVGDQFGSPTYAGDIANAIIKVIEKNIESELFHYSGEDFLTWADFAKNIVEVGQEKNIIKRGILVDAISSNEFPTKVTRPKYSVLDNSKLNANGIASSDWRSALKSIINDDIMKEQ